jgi:hypothetical protein
MHRRLIVAYRQCGSAVRASGCCSAVRAFGRPGVAQQFGRSGVRVFGHGARPLLIDTHSYRGVVHEQPHQRLVRPQLAGDAFRLGDQLVADGRARHSVPD